MFDPARIYRYTLWRKWSGGGSFVQFIGLNPSTADESLDDNTIRKCAKFAKAWGYDALCMTNLFAYRSTSPKEMMQHPSPVGPDNDAWLRYTAKDARLTVAAWSQHGNFHGRADYVASMLADFDLYCLKITDGEPHHPLYLPDTTKPFLWRERGR